MAAVTSYENAPDRATVHKGSKLSAVYLKCLLSIFLSVCHGISIILTHFLRRLLKGNG